MNHPRVVSAVGLLWALVSGCGGGGTVDGTVDSPEVATFARIQAEVFDVSCTSSSCHTAIGRAGDLVLEAASSYDALIGVAPSNSIAAADGMQRVYPGEPDKSFLYMKLAHGLTEGMGLAMPWGGPYLDESSLEVIRAWIRAGAPREGRVPGDDGRSLGTDGGDDDDIVLPPPRRGVQIAVTARAIPVGEEETACHYLKLPSSVDLDVDRIQIAVSGGSHHIHLYRPFDPSFEVPDGFEVCNAAVDFDVWELVAATQLPRSDWQLPAGVAYHFRAGEQVLVQTHFVNVGSLATTGEGRVLMNLNEAEAGSVVHYAGSIFGQDRDVFVPARSVHTQYADCVFPNAITLMAMTGHYHFRGRTFTSELLDRSGLPTAEIYRHEGYDDPLFITYEGPTAPKLSPGEGLRWTCTWVNNTNSDFEFGPFTDTNEHCNLFAFYYPAMGRNEATYCVKENGIQTTTVRTAQ